MSLATQSAAFMYCWYWALFTESYGLSTIVPAKLTYTGRLASTFLRLSYVAWSVLAVIPLYSGSSGCDQASRYFSLTSLLASARGARIMYSPRDTAAAFQVSSGWLLAAKSTTVLTPRDFQMSKFSTGWRKTPTGKKAC